MTHNQLGWIELGFVITALVVMFGFWFTWLEVHIFKYTLKRIQDDYVHDYELKHVQTQIEMALSRTEALKRRIEQPERRPVQDNLELMSHRIDKTQRLIDQFRASLEREIQARGPAAGVTYDDDVPIIHKKPPDQIVELPSEHRTGPPIHPVYREDKNHHTHETNPQEDPDD